MINGEEAGHASPQDPLLNDIVNEVGSDDLYISQITKIVLVDSGGSERDSTESLEYTDNTGASPPEVVIHGVIDITANYTIASVRLYAGTKLYFETAWSKAVEAGDKVDITVTIRMEVTGSLSGTTTGSLGSAEGLIKNVLKALIGVTRNQVGFHFGRITGVVDTTIVEIVKAVMSRTVDLANNKVSGDSGLVTPAQAGDGVALEFLNVDDNLMASFSFDASVPITSEVQLQITFEFTVS